MGKRRPFVGDRLLTVGEVAGTMRVSNMTVYRLIKSGQLGAIRVGKNYRIRESDVNRYLSDRSVKVEAEEGRGTEPRWRRDRVRGGEGGGGGVLRRPGGRGEGRAG